MLERGDLEGARRYKGVEGDSEHRQEVSESLECVDERYSCERERVDESDGCGGWARGTLRKVQSYVP